MQRGTKYETLSDLSTRHHGRPDRHVHLQEPFVEKSVQKIFISKGNLIVEAKKKVSFAEAAENAVVLINFLTETTPRNALDDLSNWKLDQWSRNLAVLDIFAHKVVNNYRFARAVVLFVKNCMDGTIEREQFITIEKAHGGVKKAEDISSQSTQDNTFSAGAQIRAQNGAWSI